MIDAACSVLVAVDSHAAESVPETARLDALSEPTDNAGRGVRGGLDGAGCWVARDVRIWNVQTDLEIRHWRVTQGNQTFQQREANGLRRT